MSEEETRSKMEEAIRKIEEFYMSDEENAGEAMFKKFAQDHAQHFVGCTSATENENKLEHTEAYQKFQEIFEAKLESLITSCGISVPEFYEQLSKDAQNDESCAFFITIVLSMSNFESFIEMMATYVEENNIS